MRYRAFISYSHKDERWGARLHKRLETYRFPKKLIGKETAKGPVPDSMKPVFRDREELSAGAHLGEEIESRLRESENLIVLCSSNAAGSHWVNDEILYFKRHNDKGRIYALIIDGEPFSGGDDECFPEALRFELDASGALTDRQAEPLAADARETGDGPRIAFLKLIAGMAGLGLDDLVRRDLQRARKRVTWITASALSAMLVMGTLTWAAIDARGEAEARKDDAEGLIEFMLTDLRDKLEPVGRLDALDAVGQKASDYYGQYDLSNLDPDTLGRYATVNHLLGDIQLRMGNISEAKNYFDPVFETTKRQLEADPNNPDRIYEHIQSVFWASRPAAKANEHETILTSYKTYLSLAKRLLEIEGESVRAVQEMAYGLSNLGQVNLELADFEQAKSYLKQSLIYYENNVELTQSPKSKMELSRRYNDMAEAFSALNDKKAAFEWELKRAKILDELEDVYPNDFQILKELASSKRERAVYLTEFKEFKKSRILLDESLTVIEGLILAEPRNDGSLKERLRIIEQYIYLADAKNDNALKEAFSEKFATYLDQRLNNRTGADFDMEWDHDKPFTSLRIRLQISIAAQDYEKIREILPTYNQLFSIVENREGMERRARGIKVHYLLTKLTADNDVADFEELQALLESESYRENRDRLSLVYALFSRQFCKTNSQCEVVKYTFKDNDFISSSFEYFQKLYPETAHNIQTEFQSKRK